ATPLPWPAANDILATTTVPSFPSTTFPVTTYGAKGDGHTDNTAAFAKAIAACNAAGGGHVVVPSGTYSTGAIHLLSNVDFHLNSGATLMFNGNAANYPPVLTRYEGVECLNHSPLVYAHGQTNIALTGSGTLDASGTASWNKGSNRAGVLDPLVNLPPTQRNVVGKLRVSYVEPYSCTNVLIQGVTLRHAIFWQLHPTLCTNVTIDGVTINTPDMGNSDGCDPESCDHVVINNCSISCHDDTIAIKSGRNADGRRLHTPCQNIVIMNSRFTGPRGMVAIGSEETGGVQNVYCFNLSTLSGGIWAPLFIKNNSLRGGIVTNINMDTITGTGHSDTSPATGAPAGVMAIMNYNGETGAFPPTIDQIHVNNMTFDSSPFAVRLVGLSNDHIGTVTVSNSTFTHIAHQAPLATSVDHLTLTKVTINGKPA
ncbi:MAG TPA: glycosyl hydrolase family 28 protein, partial [Ktedonosporobacter sp.]|nr:glycosyl hydrolase family 28 protein [Ktedonosporobacter sp.]